MARPTADAMSAYRVLLEAKADEINSNEKTTTALRGT
jgi:hypothetical protein